MPTYPTAPMHKLSNSADFSERAWLIGGTETSGVWVLETETGNFVVSVSVVIDGERITSDLTPEYIDWSNTVIAAGEFLDNGAHVSQPTDT